MNDVGNPQSVQTIGIPQPLVDGPEKATGKAMFAADFDTTETLVGRILRSPLAHAKITALDISKAEALPGVLAVVTEADCSDNYGV
ncbi:MAG: xanthine dehydrogenase family protein molybdopterin-binding subunit, partial [Alphaproteobacteria bacterium]|nr:xanthine dehydrogenase family protein molybdopterin-binding subunit [Alphaproteobacteria bacterium]